MTGVSEWSVRRGPLLERLVYLVEITDDGCWRWTGSINTYGYGVLELNKQRTMAHRASYTELVGPIPTGMTLDHVCHDPQVCLLATACPHRRCINPDHLEVMTRGANSARHPAALRTHCVNGHERTPENIWGHTSRGARCRTCRVCARARTQAWRARSQVAA